MSFGKKVKELREVKGWNRSVFAEKIGVSHVMVGRYERDETAPSIDVAKKMADILDTSVDYLVGESGKPTLDRNTLKRMEEIQNMPENLKEKMWFFIDTVIRDHKAKQAYS
jgi:transcriptional regulator with XRE-family HTH domain